MMWGTAHGIVAGSIPAPVLLLGPATGATAWATAWATAYTVLAPADLYKPIWEYEAKTLWRDLNAHFVYGTVTALAFRLLTRTATTRS